MFVIIDMSDDRKRIFEKYRRHDIEIKRFDVKGCAPFFCLKAHRRFYDAEEIKKQSVDTDLPCSRMIFPFRRSFPIWSLNRIHCR